jgi:hypothetical protein
VKSLSFLRFETVANKFVHYFGELAQHPNPPRDWVLGNEIAVEWHRLLHIDRPDRDAVDALATRIEDLNVSGGSAIFDMHYWIHAWRKWLDEKGVL